MGKLIAAAGAGAVVAASLASCGGGANAAAPGATPAATSSAASGGAPTGDGVAGPSSAAPSADSRPPAKVGSPQASPAGRATPTRQRGGAAPAVTEQSLRAAGVCATDCTITGRAGFTHPSWGPATLVTTIATGGGPRAINAAVIGSSGTVLWQLPGTAETKVNYSWKLASPASDSSGLFFINYDPGRLNGVSVLQPVDGGMKVLAGWYNNEIGRTSTFYGARLQGPGADGQYVIRVERNDCKPSCAKGSTKTTRYQWNGRVFATL